MKFKSYIGDGVYVAWDGFGIVLTTENGIADTNRIVMEPEVLDAFQQWMAALTKELNAEVEAS